MPTVTFVDTMIMLGVRPEDINRITDIVSNCITELYPSGTVSNGYKEFTKEEGANAFCLAYMIGVAVAMKSSRHRS